KLVCFDDAPQLRFLAAIPLVRIRMGFLGLAPKGRGHVGQRAAVVQTQDAIGIGGALNIASRRRRPSSPARGLEKVRHADPAPAPARALTNLAVELLPTVLDEFKTRFQP